MKNEFRGPLTGYSSDVKQDYRNRVWASIAPLISHHFSVDKRAMVLLMPSKGGEEIETAISHGIPEERIIAVDENPALIASAAWRKNRPLVKCYGSCLSRAAERISEDGYVLSAANLDLCNNFSEDLISEVLGFFESCKRFSEFCFSVTVMKGRENKATNMMLNHIFKNSDTGMRKIQDKRLRALCVVMESSNSFPLLSPTFVPDQGSYIHSKTPMAWCVFASGFTSELFGMAKSIHKMTEKFRDTEWEFFKLKPCRMDGVGRAWPEYQESQCIYEAMSIIKEVNAYDEKLRNMDFLDAKAEGMDRFFYGTYGKDILGVISGKEFSKWFRGVSLR